MLLRTILHPTDLSEDSAAAFGTACALARSTGAKLVILGCYPPAINGAEAVDRTRPDGIADDLWDALRDLNADDPRIEVEYWVEEGDPRVVILDIAKRVQADLIVMGTHGRSGLRRALLGSVAEAVSRKATCPVATIRAGAKPLTETFPPADTQQVRSIAGAEAGPDDGNVGSSADDPTREVAIPIGPITLRGTLQWCGRPRGLVLFAHGSGSSRHSPRNRYVAGVLNRAGLATLLMDLLTEVEANDREKVFDTELLACRLAAAAKWAAGETVTAGLPIGYFGASTGSAAALTAAAAEPDRVAAIVSRGGRPDLAWDDLPAVTAPTLLIVGGEDESVLGLNGQALNRLTCVKSLALVPGATHLFEEPGTLEKVANLARDWFVRHLKINRKRAFVSKECSIVD